MTWLWLLALMLPSAAVAAWGALVLRLQRAPSFDDDFAAWEREWL